MVERAVQLRRCGAGRGGAERDGMERGVKGRAARTGWDVTAQAAIDARRDSEEWDRARAVARWDGMCNYMYIYIGTYLQIYTYISINVY